MNTQPSCLVLRDGAVLNFGEMLIRLSPQDNLRLEQAPCFDVYYGGAEANTALSLAIQGDRAAYLSVLPKNRLADTALRTLHAYGVDTTRTLRQGDRVGTYFMEFGASQRPHSVLYDRKYSAISMAHASDFDWDRIFEGISVFYFSGITCALSQELEQACLEGLVAAQKQGVCTVLDVNYRGKMWSPEASQAAMKKLLPHVDVVIVNDEDAPAGLGATEVSGSLSNGIAEKDAYVDLAKRLVKDYGVKKVASVIRTVSNVENSDWMAMLYDATTQKAALSPVHKVNVLEGVGGGDAFNAGLIHGLLHNWSDQDVINYALAASILKLTIRGDANLVTEQEIMTVANTNDGLRVSR